MSSNSISLKNLIMITIVCSLLCFLIGIRFAEHRYSTNIYDVEAEPELSQYRIKIYNHEGEALKEYVNTCSIRYDRDYIFVTDEKGLKHTIYNPIGIVVIDELSNNSTQKADKVSKEVIASLTINP